MLLKFLEFCVTYFRIKYIVKQSSHNTVANVTKWWSWSDSVMLYDFLKEVYSGFMGLSNRNRQNKQNNRIDRIDGIDGIDGISRIDGINRIDATEKQPPKSTFSTSTYRLKMTN